jgi:alpha-galactosidase
VFGCCHEVFGTQKVLSRALEDICGMKDVPRNEIKVNVTGVNHFTWVTEAQYRDMDLFDVYEKFVDKYYEEGYIENIDNNWMNNVFACAQRVKFDLYKRFGVIAAAGDRHLAEFCPGDWYLKSPEQVKEWKFGLTPVSWRTEDLAKRLEKSAKLESGEMPFEIHKTGEEGVCQMRALLGLCDLVTNVNIPNRGQIPNLPLGAIVETNAIFRSDEVTPVFAGNIPTEIHSLISRICAEQEAVFDGITRRDLKAIFNAFSSDPLVTCDMKSAEKMFKEMVLNTKKYLGDYDLSEIEK